MLVDHETQMGLAVQTLDVDVDVDVDVGMAVGSGQWIVDSGHGISILRSGMVRSSLSLRSA